MASHPIQNPTDYLAPVKGQSLRLAIVGKDPFPSGATHIPFCKASWHEQRQANSSAQYVLASLGYDMAHLEKRYATPIAFFEALRDMGIVFLNVSYTLITKQNASNQPMGSPIRRRDMEALKAAYMINQPYLEKAATIVLCGEAKKIHWVAPALPTQKVIVAVHPDVRNKYSHHTTTRENWQKIWAPQQLKAQLQLPGLPGA